MTAASSTCVVQPAPISGQYANGGDGDGGGGDGGGGESLGAEAVTVIVSMLTVLPKPVARIARIVTEPDEGIVSVADEPASDWPLHVDEPEICPAVAYKTC